MGSILLPLQSFSTLPVYLQSVHRYVQVLVNLMDVQVDVMTPREFLFHYEIATPGIVKMKDVRLFCQPREPELSAAAQLA